MYRECWVIEGTAIKEGYMDKFGVHLFGQTVEVLNRNLFFDKEKAKTELNRRFLACAS